MWPSVPSELNSNMTSPSFTMSRGSSVGDVGLHMLDPLDLQQLVMSHDDCGLSTVRSAGSSSTESSEHLPCPEADECTYLLMHELREKS